MNSKWKLWIARKVLKLHYDIELDASIVARGKESGSITVNGEPLTHGDSITLTGGLDLRNYDYDNFILKFGNGTTYSGSIYCGGTMIFNNKLEEMK